MGALLGYFAMTASPLEGVAASRVAGALAAVARTNGVWVAGGLVTAPLCGLLGQRWRTRRAWSGAALVAGCACLEPWARSAVGRQPPTTAVWLAEVGAGLCALGYVAAARWRSSRGALSDSV
jgi:hypothetical protein